ncbi:MAG: fibronectin type III domain-containing protein, partial [Thermoleophilaceae bacterium]|nr:fibronectin type III domain-containing protein [Thermoleophilaceae bacterium]
MATLVLLIPLGAPSGASAAKVVSAKAVINSCGADQLAMTSRAKPKKRVRGRSASRRLRKLRRRIRGARLETRFSAFALFGGERRSPWLRTDRGGRASHSFSGLPADTWSGFVRFRWRKGGRTVASSFVNSSNGRVGGRRGRSLCSIGVGVLPRDTVAPFVTIFPSDSAWRRPFTAKMFSKDDFSGVAATEYRINGGRLQRGPNVPLGTEGVARIDYRARDAAGNNSAFKRAVLRVDTRPPTAPVVDAARFNPSGDVTPTIAWARSSDTASGVKRYTVEARNSAGQVVASRSVKATGAARQAVTLPALHSGFASRLYTIRVYAFDGVEFRSASSTPRTFRIDTRPVYSNSFSTTAQCDDFTLAGASDNPFACADDRNDGVFPGRE